MNFDDLFPTSYYKAVDVEDGPLNLHINGVKQVPMNDGEPKPVLTFSDGSKDLILNVTNGRTLAEIYGRDLNSWAGKPIQLFWAETEFQGRRVPCIRLREPKQREKGGGKPPTLQSEPPPNLDDLDDEIPF